MGSVAIGWRPQGAEFLRGTEPLAKVLNHAEHSPELVEAGSFSLAPPAHPPQLSGNHLPAPAKNPNPRDLVVSCKSSPKACTTFADEISQAELLNGEPVGCMYIVAESFVALSNCANCLHEVSVGLIRHPNRLLYSFRWSSDGRQSSCLRRGCTGTLSTPR